MIFAITNLESALSLLLVWSIKTCIIHHSLSIFYKTKLLSLMYQNIWSYDSTIQMNGLFEVWILKILMDNRLPSALVGRCCGGRVALNQSVTCFTQSSQLGVEPSFITVLWPKLPIIWFYCWQPWEQYQSTTLSQKQPMMMQLKRRNWIIKFEELKTDLNWDQVKQVRWDGVVGTFYQKYLCCIVVTNDRTLGCQTSNSASSSKLHHLTARPCL